MDNNGTINSAENENDFGGIHGIRLECGYILDIDLLHPAIWQEYLENGDSQNTLRKIAYAKDKLNRVYAAVCQPRGQFYQPADTPDGDRHRLERFLEDLDKLEKAVKRIAYPELYTPKTEELQAELEEARNRIEELELRKDPPKIDLPVRGLWEVVFLFEILEKHGYAEHVEDNKISAHFTLKGKPISPTSLKTTRSSEKGKRPSEKEKMNHRLFRQPPEAVE